MAMATNGAKVTWLCDFKVVRTKPIATVTAKTTPGQSYLEVPNSCCWVHVAFQARWGKSPHDVLLKKAATPLLARIRFAAIVELFLLVEPFEFLFISECALCLVAEPRPLLPPARE